MKRILVVFGTRPEAIKMCPLVRELQCRDGVRVTVCVSGQHRQMLDGVLEAFAVVPDYDLSIMRPGQTLAELTVGILSGMDTVLEKVSPELVLVHGDTATAFAAALACFYRRIPVGHVEAGLRTYRMDAPYPEELNRRVIDLMAAYHFAPTEHAKQNLLNEGVDPRCVFVTGNTAIDALRTTVCASFSHPLLAWAEGSRLLILTAHRRENLGEPMRKIFRAVRRVATELPDVRVLFPIHQNPVIRRMAEEELGMCDRIRLTEPLDAVTFHNLLARSTLILTDSGGIQEEAPFLGKPVLVMRDTTERPEGVEAGTLKPVGTEEEGIYRAVREVLADRVVYETMARAKNPYGDGWACRRIADILCRTKLGG